jgi:hypothetical protein
MAGVGLTGLSLGFVFMVEGKCEILSPSPAGRAPNSGQGLFAVAGKDNRAQLKG